MSADDDFGDDRDCRGGVIAAAVWVAVGWIGVAWAVWMFFTLRGR
jgi:hypothetical protein